MAVAAVCYQTFSFCECLVESFALYIASTGDSFSCANSSEISTDSTSPIRILVLLRYVNAGKRSDLICGLSYDLGI